MTKLDRRTFLRRSALAGGALCGLQGLVALGLRAETSSKGGPEARTAAGGYGPLRPTKTKNTGEELLAMPEGFQYNVLGKAGSPMADGRPTPQKHDGMAAFAVGGMIRLVRNQEIVNLTAKAGVALADAANSYDPLAGGGTTTVIVDPETREVVRDFVSLSGTLQNCAGGPTPWGSWLSCEENFLGPTKIPTEEGNPPAGGFEKAHGYCFEVPASADDIVAPVPLRAMGRFVHEAIAVDPATGIVYETEDRRPSGFYRFLPEKPGDLAAGGRLQMLAVRDRPGYDTRKGQTVGAALSVVWVDIDDPDPAAAVTDAAAVYKQGLGKGGATFDRLEGCWYGNGTIYFDATSGGDAGLGQVWQYRPEGKDEGRLTLLFESRSREILNHPDNLCVTPRGGLLICEDGGGSDLYVRGLTPKGEILDFLRNLSVIPGSGDPPGYSEFAGATFSPDGKTLFVNLQTPGMTCAIWGPWKRGVL